MGNPASSVLELHEAADHQPGASQQHDGERQLGDDHGPAEPARPAVAGGAASAFLQDLVVVRLRHVQSRGKAKEDGRQRTDPGHVREHDVIDPEVDPVRLPRITDRGIEGSHACVGQEQPDRSANKRQHQALNQQLTHDAPARGAERRAYGDLTRSVRRAREQQVRDVRAGDEQHEADRAHHDEKHGLGGAADVSLGEGFHADAGKVLVRVRVGSREPFRDAVHLGLRLTAGRRVRQPSEDAKRARIPLFLRFGRDRRRPHLGVVRKSHALWHDADNRRRLSVHAHRRAEHVRIGAIPVLPEAVADDDDGLGGLELVGRR